MFKVGDKVKCVDVKSSGGVLIKDQIYTVKEVSPELVWVDDVRTRAGWGKERFELVPMFKVGDKVKMVSFLLAMSPIRNYPQVGEIYTIDSISCSSYIHLVNDAGEVMYGGWQFERFELVKEEPTFNIKMVEVVRKVVSLEQLNQMIKDHVDFEME
jgi:hypothetical protein